MKKFVTCALLLGLIVTLGSPVFAWDAAKQKSLGTDKNGLTWYLLDYGKDENGVPFAVSRRYYTNATIKNETIELLMSKFALSPEVAGSLYFTEYGYEYSKDGSQFALTYLRHYDMLGNEIHGTVYGTDDNPKTFGGIPAGSIPAKAATYAVGKGVKTVKAAPTQQAKPQQTKTTAQAAPVQQETRREVQPQTVPQPVKPVQIQANSGSSSAPATTWDASKQKTLGPDKNNMTWYLLDYGKTADGVPYAVSRKYYTNTKFKNETIELLMSKFAISPEVAGSLYFTEYGYEYTKDGKQFALSYLRHYDMLGNEIHGTVYGTDDNPKTFAGIPAGSTPAKAVAYAMGKNVSTTTGTTAKTNSQSVSNTVPSSRVVRAKKK